MARSLSNPRNIKAGDVVKFRRGVVSGSNRALPTVTGTVQWVGMASMAVVSFPGSPSHEPDGFWRCYTNYLVRATDRKVA